MNSLRLVLLSLLACALVAGQPAYSAEDPVLAVETALQTSMRRQQQLELYQQSLAALETEFGPFDRSLLEALQGLADVLVEAGDYDEANRVLERRLQLFRTLDGPTTLDQLPTVVELINNDIRRQDWRNVTDRFEYIFWLRTQDPGIEAASLLSARDEKAAWHLAAVYVDSPSSRVRNFLRARELYRENLLHAIDVYGEDNPLIIPWIYQSAVMQYQVYAFLKSEDELGYEARQDIMEREGRDIDTYLRQGLNLVKRIGRIVEEQADPEAQAMAMLYEADFQMLLGLGTAARLYRDAMDKFADAGISEQAIDDFFLRPAILPVQKLHLSVTSALAQQDADGFRIETGKAPASDREAGRAAEPVHMGNFIAWNESLAFARRPLEPALVSMDDLELHEVQLAFSINSRGKSRNPKTLMAEPDRAGLKRDARDAIKEIQFRPRFVSGRWKPVDNVKIRYLVPPKI